MCETLLSTISMTKFNNLLNGIFWKYLICSHQLVLDRYIIIANFYPTLFMSCTHCACMLHVYIAFRFTFCTIVYQCMGDWWSQIHVLWTEQYMYHKHYCNRATWCKQVQISVHKLCCSFYCQFVVMFLVSLQDTIMP